MSNQEYKPSEPDPQKHPQIWYSVSEDRWYEYYVPSAELKQDLEYQFLLRGDTNCCIYDSPTQPIIKQSNGERICNMYFAARAATGAPCYSSLAFLLERTSD